MSALLDGKNDDLFDPTKVLYHRHRQQRHPHLRGQQGGEGQAISTDMLKERP